MGPAKILMAKTASIQWQVRFSHQVIRDMLQDDVNNLYWEPRTANDFFQAIMADLEDKTMLTGFDFQIKHCFPMPVGAHFSPVMESHDLLDALGQGPQ